MSFCLSACQGNSSSLNENVNSVCVSICTERVVILQDSVTIFQSCYISDEAPSVTVFSDALPPLTLSDHRSISLCLLHKHVSFISSPEQTAEDTLISLYVPD